MQYITGVPSNRFSLTPLHPNLTQNSANLSHFITWRCRMMLGVKLNSKFRQKLSCWRNAILFSSWNIQMARISASNCAQWMPTCVIIWSLFGTTVTLARLVVCLIRSFLTSNWLVRRKLVYSKILSACWDMTILYIARSTRPSLSC